MLLCNEIKCFTYASCSSLITFSSRNICEVNGRIVICEGGGEDWKNFGEEFVRGILIKREICFLVL